MKKRKTSSRARPLNRLHLIYTLLALTFGLSCHSCANLPSGSELEKAGDGLETLVKELGKAVREHASLPSATSNPPGLERTTDTTESFAACRHFFAAGKPPVIAPKPTHRALCYDAFAMAGDSGVGGPVGNKPELAGQGFALWHRLISRIGLTRMLPGRPAATTFRSKLTGSSPPRMPASS